MQSKGSVDLGVISAFVEGVRAPGPCRRTSSSQGR